jgi:hypothetical protein
MYLYRLCDSDLAELPEETLPIGLGEEDCRSVYPAHDRVKRVSGNDDSGMSGQEDAAARMENLGLV